MGKNNTFKLFIILIIAFLFRIWYLDKPEGLWNDEYVSWYIASQKDLWVFFTDMIRNCHTPLYYLYLKVWMFLFQDTDTSLRYSSVIPSLLSIPVMYYTGKELKDSNLGLFCAFVTAISSFLIYFAQEVRLYSLLFLFTACSLLFSLKVMKKPNVKNMIGLFISCSLITLLHTLGIIYVFLLLIFVTYYVVSNLEGEQKKKVIQKIFYFVIVPALAIFIVISPFLYNILTFSSLSQFWTGLSLSEIILTFTDYFSPIQANIINTPDTFQTFLYSHGRVSYIFIIFSIIPTLIGLYSLINAYKQNNKKIRILMLIISIFFLYLILISYTGRMVLITKYSIELYPALILILCYGLYKISDKRLRKTLIIIYIGLNLLYLIAAADSAPKRTRPEGHRAVVDLLRTSRLQENDFVLLTYYGKDKFDRYLTDKDKYNFHSINKFNFNYFLYNDDNYKRVINRGKYLYKNEFKEFPNDKLMQYSKYTFQNNMKKGDRFGIVYLNNVSFLSNGNIQNILKDEKQYKKTPYIFLVFSMLKNNIMLSFKDGYKLDSITSAGDWILVVYEKT